MSLKNGKVSKAVRRREKRLNARIKSFNERGAGKIADGMRKPGSGNRKK